MLEDLSMPWTQLPFISPNVIKLYEKRDVEGLIRALAYRDGFIRYQAATHLRLLGNRRAVDPLIDALGDEDESVRRAAVSSLGTLGDELPTGFASIGTRAVDAVGNRVEGRHRCAELFCHALRGPWFHNRLWRAQLRRMQPFSADVPHGPAASHAKTARCASKIGLGRSS